MSRPDDLFHLAEEVARLATLHSIPELQQVSDEMMALADDFPEELIEMADTTSRPSITLASGGMGVRGGSILVGNVTANDLKITP